MFTTAGVTALTMEENPWASWGGTAAAVLSFNAGGAKTSTATTTPAMPLPIRKLSFAFMGQPSNKRDEWWTVEPSNHTATWRTFATATGKGNGDRRLFQHTTRQSPRLDFKSSLYLFSCT